MLVAVGVYAVLFFVVRPYIFHGNSDFACFYRAGKMVQVGDAANVYNLAVETQYDARWSGQYGLPNRGFASYPFVSPPFTLAVFAAMAGLPYWTAWALWCAANFAMLLAIPFLLGDVLGRGRLLAVALVAPPFFVPLDFALFRGQVIILLAFLFSWMFRELWNGHAARAGCILALVTLKPQFAVPMLLALLLAREWKAVAGFLVTCAGLLLLSVGMVGWKVTLSYPMVLRQFDNLSQEMWGPKPQVMANIRGFLYSLLHTQIPAHRLAILTLAPEPGGDDSGGPRHCGGANPCPWASRW